MQKEIQKLIALLIQQQPEQTERALGVAEDKQPNLSWLGGLFAGVVITSLTIASAQIKNPKLQELSGILIGEVGEIATILTDNDKNNLKQLEGAYVNNWKVKVGKALRTIELIVEMAAPKGNSVADFILESIGKIREAMA